MKPISTPYDGRRWWDSNLRTPACRPLYHCATDADKSCILTILTVLSSNPKLSDLESEDERLGKASESGKVCRLPYLYIMSQFGEFGFPSCMYVLGTSTYLYCYVYLIRTCFL